MSLGKIYCYEGSWRVKRIQAVVAWSGAEIEFVPVQHHGMSSGWPLGSLPAFESADGFHLNDNTAISRYCQCVAIPNISVLAPVTTVLRLAVVEKLNSDLVPADVQLRAEITMWQMYADAELSAWLTPPAGMHVGFIRYEPETFKFFWDRVMTRLGVLESHLEGREYLVGGTCTLADILIASTFDEKLAVHRLYDQSVRDKFPNVFAHFNRITRHPKIAHIWANNQLIQKTPERAPYEGPDFMAVSWWRT